MSMQTIVSGCLVMAGAALAVDDVEMRPSKLALFKNGYGFISLEGQLGSASLQRLRSLPVPSMGTFWLSTPPTLALRSLTSKMMEVERPGNLTMLSLAFANPGAQVVVTFRD